MKTGVKQYIAGGVLLLVSTLFVPQGVSDFASAAGSGEPAPASAGVNLAIGILLVLSAAALLAWGYWLTHRHGAPPRGPVDDPDEPLFRPGYGGQPGTADWREHPLRPRDGEGGNGGARP
jgi:hypothetical protein